MTADWAKLPYDVLGKISVADRQRGPGREPGRLRHLVEAARDDRVGVATPAGPLTNGVFRGRVRAVAFRPWPTRSSPEARRLPSICPWCSAPLQSADLERCPSCGATLIGDVAASRRCPGVTAVDAAALIRARHDAGHAAAQPPAVVDQRRVPRRDATTATDAEALAPPDLDVRREMLRLELEAEVANLQAEADALRRRGGRRGRGVEPPRGRRCPRAVSRPPRRLIGDDDDRGRRVAERCARRDAEACRGGRGRRRADRRPTRDRRPADAEADGRRGRAATGLDLGRCAATPA